MLLNAEQFEYIHSLTETAGVQVTLHDQTESPQGAKTFLVGTGQHAHVDTYRTEVGVQKTQEKKCQQSSNRRSVSTQVHEQVRIIPTELLFPEWNKSSSSKCFKWDLKANFQLQDLMSWVFLCTFTFQTEYLPPPYGNCKENTQHSEVYSKNSCFRDELIAAVTSKCQCRDFWMENVNGETFPIFKIAPIKTHTLIC